MGGRHGWASVAISSLGGGCPPVCAPPQLDGVPPGRPLVFSRRCLFQIAAVAERIDTDPTPSSRVAARSGSTIPRLTETVDRSTRQRRPSAGPLVQLTVAFAEAGAPEGEARLGRRIGHVCRGAQLHFG